MFKAKKRCLRLGCKLMAVLIEMCIRGCLNARELEGPLLFTRMSKTNVLEGVEVFTARP